MKNKILYFSLIFSSLSLLAEPVVYNVYEPQITAHTDRQRLFASVQGLASRQDKWIFLGNADGDFWAKQLQNEGVQYTYLSNWTTFLNSCSDLLQRYVLYDPAIVDGIPKNAEIAFAMAALSNAVIVTPSLESQIQSYGGQKILDVRTWNWSDVPMAKLDANWFGNVQTDRTDGISYLADFCVANTAAWRFVPPAGPAGEPNFFDYFNVGATFLGWFFGSEGDAISAYSGRGMYAIPADWTANLAALSRSSSAVKNEIKQPNRIPKKIEGTNTHLVAIIISDGDNFNLWNGMHRNNEFWNNGNRGKFAVNWTYPPRISEFAKIAHKYYFENATTNDYFISGPSGAGYYYPDILPNDKAREKFAVTDNFFLEKSDLQVWCPMFMNSDFNSARDILEEMLEKMPAVRAVIPFTYGGAYKAFGDIRTMIRGIPVLSPNYSLWNGFDSPTNAAQDINSRSTDLNNPDAYSVVVVHIWSHNLNDIANDFVAKLAPHVRVVDVWTLANTFASHVGNFGMVKNGTAENGASWPDDWYHSATMTEWSEEKSVSPSHSLKLSDSSSTENADWRSVFFSLPAPPRSLEFSWHWCYENLQGTWQAAIRWYTNNTTDSFIGEELFSPNGNSQTVFLRETRYVTPPANARYADVTFRSWDSGSAGTMWLDNIAVRIVYPYINVDKSLIKLTGVVDAATVATVTVSNVGEGILSGSVTDISPPFSVENGSSYSITNTAEQKVMIKFQSNVQGTFTNDVIFTGGDGANLKLIGEAVPEPTRFLILNFGFLIYYLLTIKRKNYE